MSILFEDSRTQLVADSKRGKKERDGKNRFQKRLKSHVASSVRQYNRIDMNELFKNNIITISIEVKGETDDYLVKISYGGFLDALKDELKRNNTEIIDLRLIIRSLIIAFNRNDVYISCSCPDFFYRFGYWATINNINSGEPQLIPSDETNPNNHLGPGCKHVMLVLSNTSWLIKVASVINNYIKYMAKHREQQYATIIYPAIYNKKYTGPVQQNIFDDEIETDTEVIDKSNEEGRVSGRFSSENQPVRNPSIRKARKRNMEITDEEEGE